MGGNNIRVNRINTEKWVANTETTGLAQSTGSFNEAPVLGWPNHK